MKVYYAHSMRIYHTKREEKELCFLSKSGFNIVNPSEVEFKNMKDYLDMVSACKMVILSEYKKGIGKGVFMEVAHALYKNIPVFVLCKLLGIFYLKPVKSLKIKDRDNWRVYGGIIC